MPATAPTRQPCGTISSIQPPTVRSVEELERSIQTAELQRLLKIEKSLVFFITSLRGNDNLLVKLKNLKSQREFFDPDLVEDVEIELRQAQDTARIYSDILSGTMDAFASVISNNLNVIMKRMTCLLYTSFN